MADTTQTARALSLQIAYLHVIVREEISACYLFHKRNAPQKKIIQHPSRTVFSFLFNAGPHTISKISEKV